LLISRALGRAGVVEVEMIVVPDPSPGYAAGALRSSCVPAAPHDEFVPLFALPSIERSAAAASRTWPKTKIAAAHRAIASVLLISFINGCLIMMVIRLSVQLQDWTWSLFRCDR